MPVQKNERVFDFYQLEDRILLSADGLDAGDAPVHRDVELLDALMGQMLESGSVAASDALFGVDHFDSADAAPDHVESNDRVDTPEFDPSRPLEVVFVDAGVEDAETLLAGLRDPSADGTQWVIVRLSADENGIAQISQTLAELSGVDAIHILSHGDGDGIQLGDTRLDQNTAIAHAGSIAGWQNALDADADLLIYGCDLASTDSGRELIEMLAAVCDCDVAASDDLTGHQSLGGDWDLEYAVGSIETQIAFDSQTQHAWQHVFAAAVDATSTGTSSGSDFVVSHTTSGSDRLMLVGVSINLAGADQVSSITYNGDSLSLVGTRVDGDARVEIWSLVAPDVGTYNVDINLTGTSDGNTAGVMTFTGVDKFNPLGTFASGSGVGGSGSVTVSSATDDLVFAAIAVDDSTNYDLVPGAGQTEAWDLIGGPDINGGGSTEAGAASVVMDWTWSGSDNWAAAGVSINSMSYESTSFREGVGGYTGTQDTSFNGDSPDTSYGNDASIAVDDDHANGFESVGLIQFDSLFGNGPGQIPLGSTIVSASLTINGVTTGDAAGTLSLHEMLTSWSESSTYNSLGSGLQSGTEYVAVADGSVTDLSTTGWYTITGLEDALQTWSDGSTNHGWALFNDNSNGFDFDSSEEASASLRPELSVQYLAPVAPVGSSIEGSTLAYTENDGAIAITSTLALSDSDDTDLQSAVVQITGNYANGQDVLTFVDQNGISGVWNAGSGTLTLTGTATIAQYETALRSITYTNTSDNPSTATRTVAFTVNDGNLDSNTQTRDISIAAVNDAPTVATNTGTTVLEGATGTAITTAMLNEGDVDDGGVGLTYTVTDVTDNGTLYLAGFGALGLNDTFTQADIDAGDVTYDHDGSETTSDAFSFSLADGGENGATPATGTFNFTVTPVNDDPLITSPNTVAVDENQTAVLTVTATDPEAATPTYSISGGADQAFFSIDTNSGVLTFISPPDYENPLDVEGDNIYEVQVTASDGTTGSTVQTISVTVLNVTDTSFDGPSTVIWSENGVSTPLAADFNGNDFSIEVNTADIGGPWRVIDGAESPDRDEKIVIGVDAAGNLSGQMWDGSSWTAFTFNDFATVSDSTKWGFAIEYESISGDAVLVWNNGTTGTDGLSYRVWNGTAWSATNTISTPLAGEAEQMRFASDVGSDEMVLVVSNAANQDYALVWDGNAWGNAQTLTTTAGTSNTEVFVTYESQSGDAMVVYGDNTANALYRVWDGGTWSAQQSITPPGGVTGQVTWTNVASDPNSDRIAFAAHTANNETWLAVWDGSTWGDKLLASTAENDNTFLSVAVAFESQSGDLLAVYSENHNRFSYRTWDSGGGWSAETQGVDLKDDVRTLTLTSRPETNQIMLTALDAGGDLNNPLWDGSSWSERNEVENNTGETTVQPFVFLWDQNPPEFVAAANDTAFWFSTDGDVNSKGAAGLNSWTAGEVLRLGDPDLLLEPVSGTTSGTATSVFNLDTFGGDTKIDALHYVTADLQVGSSNFNLLEGDVLFSTRDNETLVSTNTLAITANDVIVFRADTAGDYSSGSFYLLLEDPVGADVRGISLVEQNTTVGDTTLQAGDFLLTTDAVGLDTSLLLFETTDVGVGTTSGTLQTLLDGSDTNLGFSEKINGVELYETNTIVGGHTILAGTIVVSVERDSDVGSNTLAVKKHDMVALSVTQTTLVAGAGNGAATAALLMDGSDIGLSAGAEKITAIAAFPNNQSPTDIAPNSPSVNEFTDTSGGVSVATLTASDVDAGETFTYSIVGGADAANFSIGGVSSDELVLDDGILDYESKSSYSVTVRVTDSALNYYDETLTVNVNDLNDAPTVATNTGTTVLEGSTGTAITTAMLNEGDVDDSGAGLTYTITDVTDNGTLSLAGFGALGLNDTFTQADIDAGDVTYDHDGSETASDAFSFSLADGGEDGATPATGTFNFTVTAVNDAPLEASIEGSTLAYTENDGAVAITSTLALSDVDDTNLESAVVQITGNYANGQDVLTFVDQNGISGVWNAGAGTLTLTGTATIAQYQAALRSITYTNTSDNPSTATRTVAFTVNDGDVDSNTQTRDISIAATNDDPTGAGLASDITVTEDVSSNVDLSALNLADLDENGGNLTVTLTTSTGGDLSASTGGGVTVGGSGTGTLALTGTLADLNTFLDTPANIQYLHGTPHTFGNDADTIQVVVNDGGNTGSGGGTDQTIGTVNVDITAVNDEQVLATNTGDTVPEGSVGNTVTTAMLETTDVDNTDTQLVYTVDAVPTNGTLYRLGVALNVNDTFTQADIDAGLITYDHDGSQTSSDSFDFTVDDGAGTTTSSTFNWTISNVNDAPLEASIEGSALAYTENDGAVAITSTLALSDVDDTNLESAVVQITGNYANGQDVLAFVDQNGISGVWNAGSGTLTLSGTATVAQYEAALRSITYTNSSDNPSTTTRTVAFTVNDGDVDSNTQTRDISIVATNDDPTGAGLPSDIAVTEDVSSNVDLSALNLADLDENGGNLTVTLSTSTGGDLTASTGGGVTVGGSGTGTLTLTGTLADLNTFLDTPANIQYLHGTPHTFGNDADTIQVVVNDGGNTGSGGGTDQTIGTVNVDITAVNDEQVLATNTGDTVIEGSTGNTVTTAMLETTDVDNLDSQLVYTVDAVPTNGMLYRNAVVLNVSDTFTQADIDGGLITYDHDDSQTSSDSFDFTVDDGAGATSSSTFNWTVSAVNDAPVEASIEVSTLAYTENGGAVAITSTLALSDVDDTNLESAVVQITGNYANGQDVLTFVDQNGISGVWNAGSGTLTLTGTATVAQYEAALRSITYTNSSDNPSTATRTVAFTVNDGDVDSNTQTRDISIAATNDDPTGTGLPSDVTVTEDVSSNVDLSALNLSDLDENGGNLTVTLSTSTGGDLTASTGGGVTVGGSGTGTLTLTGTLADLNTFLDTPANIQYLHGTPHTFGNDADTIQVVVNDGGNTGSGGGTDQTIGTVNVDITAVNDEQVLATNTGDTVPEGSVGNTVTTAMLETTDVDNTDSQLVYTVDAGPTNGTLYRVGVALNVSDTFTQADIDAGLITYDHDGSQTSSDSFDFTVNDGAGTMTSSTFSWTISNVNDAPLEASIEGSTLAYTENDGAVAITATLALSDVDDTNLESAVVQITGNYANGQDVLTFVDQNGISGVWNAGSGRLTLTGTATLAQYEAALRSITYTNTSDNPSTSTRTVAFTVNDGDVDSNTQTRDISVASINDDPTNAGGLPSDITVTEDISSNVDLSALNLADLDANGASLTVTLSTSTGGDLSASTGGGVAVGGSGTGTLTLTGTLADLNTFLDTPANIQYLHGTPHSFGNDADTIQVVVNDGGNTGSGGGTDQAIGTVNVDITAVNDSPTLSANTGMTVAEGSIGAVVTSAMLNGADVDDAGAGLVYTITDATDNGVLTLSGFGTLGLGATFTQADLDNGDVTYSHDDGETIGDAFDFSLADGGEDGASAITGTFTITVTPVNDNTITPLVDSDPSANTVAEDAVIGTIVGITALASDADSGDNVTYSLDDDAGGRFSIETLTGLVRVAAALDHETSAVETITVRGTSGDGSTTTMTSSINVSDVNEAPTATGEMFTVNSGETLTVAVTGLIFNDTDIDGDALAVVLVTTPTQGAFTLAPGGGFTYTPNAGFFGQDSFFYRVTDGTLSSNVVEAVLEVPLAAAATSGAGASQSDEPASDPTSGLDSESTSASDGDPASELETQVEESAGSSDAATATVTAPAGTTEKPDGRLGQNPHGGGAEADGQLRDGLIQTERQLYGVYAVTDNATNLTLRYAPELQQLERLLRQDLQQAIVWTQWDDPDQQEEDSPMLVMVGAAGAGMSVFSIGYVFWALRGGALMTVFASSLPAWRFIDPIAMLSAYRSSLGAADEGLESLLRGRK
ncbi:cadherin-like domain-containing protein [Stieleria neptunia]|uniref:cadherin-like domain-containing protein n=1 Tax=Stieleria neptunia TaxID=2527979 RepID=UPI0011AA143E|nr:cadherin-like domain-containing protein [Stieleria neptunia]